MPESHRITDLARIAGVTPRTVRYYIGQGLLRPAARSGPGATYDDDQLRRLQLIRRLQRQHLPLAEIRSRLAQLDPTQVAELLAEPDPEEPRSTALEYVRRHLSTPPPAPLSAASASTGGPKSRGAMRYLALHRPTGSPETPPASAPAFLRMRAAVPPIEPMTAAPAQAEMRSTWERIALSPDLELHVRRPLDRRGNRILDQILKSAREALSAD
jgi:DNA-binding transcriptional MerR regulator